jgi:hypothetical protein
MSDNKHLDLFNVACRHKVSFGMQVSSASSKKASEPSEQIFSRDVNSHSAASASSLQMQALAQSQIGATGYQPSREMSVNHHVQNHRDPPIIAVPIEPYWLSGQFPRSTTHSRIPFFDLMESLDDPLQPFDEIKRIEMERLQIEASRLEAAAQRIQHELNSSRQTLKANLPSRFSFRDSELGSAAVIPDPRLSASLIPVNGLSVGRNAPNFYMDLSTGTPATRKGSRLPNARDDAVVREEVSSAQLQARGFVPNGDRRSEHEEVCDPVFPTHINPGNALDILAQQPSDQESAQEFQRDQSSILLNTPHSSTPQLHGSSAANPSTRAPAPSSTALSASAGPAFEPQLQPHTDTDSSKQVHKGPASNCDPAFFRDQYHYSKTSSSNQTGVPLIYAQKLSDTSGMKLRQQVAESRRPSLLELSKISPPPSENHSVGAQYFSDSRVQQPQAVSCEASHTPFQLQLGFSPRGSPVVHSQSRNSVLRASASEQQQRKSASNVIGENRRLLRQLHDRQRQQQLELQAELAKMSTAQNVVHTTAASPIRDSSVSVQPLSGPAPGFNHATQQFDQHNSSNDLSQTHAEWYKPYWHSSHNDSTGQVSQTQRVASALAAVRHTPAHSPNYYIKDHFQPDDGAQLPEEHYDLTDFTPFTAQLSHDEFADTSEVPMPSFPFEYPNHMLSPVAAAVDLSTIRSSEDWTQLLSVRMKENSNHSTTRSPTNGSHPQSPDTRYHDSAVKAIKSRKTVQVPSSTRSVVTVTPQPLSAEFEV